MTRHVKLPPEPLPPEPEPGCWRIGEVDAVRVPTVEGEYANPDGDDWFAPTLGKWYACGNVAVKVASDPRYTMRPDTARAMAAALLSAAEEAQRANG